MLLIGMVEFSQSNLNNSVSRPCLIWRRISCLLELRVPEYLAYRQGILDTVLKKSNYINCYALAAGEHYIVYATTSLGLARIRQEWQFLGILS
jgi:hypothetical protein